MKQTQKHSDDNSAFIRKTSLRYDPDYGLLKKKIENFGSSSPLTTEYLDYDAFGNLLAYKVSGDGAPSITCRTDYDASKRFVAKAYTEPTTTETKFTYDAWGNVKTSEDPLTVVNYSYSSVGKPRIIEVAGATYKMSYNDVGLLERLSDPDAGTRSYTYYADGRTKTMSDRKETTTYNYDTYGRHISTSMPDATIHYKYGSYGNNFFRIVNEKMGNNEISHFYDDYGRLTSETRKIGFNSYNFSYKYNSLGQVESATYPHEVTISLQYDELGNRVSSQLNGQTIWALDTVSGLQTVSKLGSDMVHQASFTDEGLLKSLKTTAKSGTVLNMDFSFDQATSHLNSRTGMMPDEEHFTYDALNRLTISKNEAGDTLMAVTYTDNGNISSKTGLGKYTYSRKLYYPHTDHLGSIVKITDPNGTPVFAATYDPWGKQTVTKNDIAFHRGYTGHEHLPEFGLINMNGRLYHPDLGRFLSPDPYVQMPDFAQSFNRYTYCLNNPLMFTDPSGYNWRDLANIVKWVLIGGVAIDPMTALVSASALTSATIVTVGATSQIFATTARALDNTLAYFDDNDLLSKRNTNSFKIDWGVFKSDPNKNFVQNFGMIVSRLTWENIQTNIGLGYSHFRNAFGKVDRVDYLGGATYLTHENASDHNGVTIGSFINMNIRGEITTEFETWVTTQDVMYMHEYGHTIDGRRRGPLYMFTVGIPSAISAVSSSEILNDPHRLWTHDIFSPEMRANRRASDYFGKYYGVNWDYLNEENDRFWDYPLYH